jgi:hypothetical protein
MSFLNPAFLFALAASAVPLLIHLLSRRRAREVQFSSVRFLRQSDRKSMRRINLRRLILLLLRTAAIALVALAFARPVVTGRAAALFPGSEPKSVVVMLDRSYSMSVRGSGGTAFERAAAAALDIAGGLGTDDELTVALFDERTVEILSTGRPMRSSVAAALAGEETALGTTDLRGALGAGLGILSRSRKTAAELFIISDFQRSAITGPMQEQAQERVRIFLVPVRPAAGPNVAIERVTLPGTAVHSGETVPVSIFVRNTSPESPAGFPLRIDLEGRRIVEKEMELPAGGSAAQTFEIDPGRSGWIRGSVSCREDMLPADDRRLFTLKVREKTPALLLSGDGAFYLAQALAPDGADGDVELREKGWNAYTTADLASAEVVVAGPGGVPRSGDAPLLRRFAERGGRVVVFISPGMEEFASSISSLDITVSPRGSAGGFTELEAPRAASPLVPMFGPADIEALSGLRFTAPPRVTGLPAGTAGLTFADGSPFLWAEAAGEGELVFAAFSPVPESGDLVLSPWFLPLVQHMTLAPLSVSPGREGALAGQFVMVPAAGEGCSIVLPDGTEYVDPAGDTAGLVAVPAGYEQGYLSSGCGEGWEVAVNPDCRRESQLEYMQAGEAADSLGLAAWASASAGTGVAEAVREAREGREIAEILIIAAALLLAAELAVAQGAGRGEGAAA